MKATGPAMKDLTEQDLAPAWQGLGVALAGLVLTETDRHLLRVLVDGPQAGDSLLPSLPSYALRKVLAARPTEVAARLSFWANHANPAVGEALLTVAVAVAPDDPEARLGLAWRCFDRGALPDALRHAAHAYQIAPKVAAAAYGFFLLETGDLPGADAVLQAALAVAPDHPPLHWYRGLLLQRQGDLPGAAGALRAACALDPSLHDAAFTLAWVLHDLGEQAEAEVWCGRALDAEATGDRQMQAAWFALRRRDYATAEAQYRAAAESIPLADPRSLLIYRHWAEALQCLGRGEEARSCLTNALHAHPAAAPLWYRLGCIAQEAGDWQAADYALGQAHHFVPTWGDAFIRRAQVLHGRGMADGVVWLLEQGLFLAPETVGARALLAAAYREQGKTNADATDIPEAFSSVQDSLKPDLRGKDQRRAEAAKAFVAWLQSGLPLRLPVADPTKTPDISVVIVLFNQVGLTLETLTALSAQTGPSFETILVDNGSIDATPDLLARVQGAKILRNADNRGFLLAANQGAVRARGRHILFLNSDAFVQPDALAAALARIDGDGSIGAVGGKIILTDGRLQEAGNWVDRNGAAQGYGRGDDPDASAYGFAREVDYCSGAFLLVRQPLWAMLGGFDPIFAPAYYEDTDLCLRVWRAGFRVVYEPSARVIHVEGGSAATEAEPIRLMEKNRSLFIDRHPDARGPDASL
jgi:GT2 family glycosyltransferase/tetratricopeptide (TPR) repeat protein